MRQLVWVEKCWLLALQQWFLARRVPDGAVCRIWVDQPQIVITPAQTVYQLVTIWTTTLYRKCVTFQPQTGVPPSFPLIIVSGHIVGFQMIVMMNWAISTPCFLRIIEWPMGDRHSWVRVIFIHTITTQPIILNVILEGRYFFGEKVMFCWEESVLVFEVQDITMRMTHWLNDCVSWHSFSFSKLFSLNTFFFIAKRRDAKSSSLCLETSRQHPFNTLICENSVLKFAN